MVKAEKHARFHVLVENTKRLHKDLSSVVTDRGRLRLARGIKGLTCTVSAAQLTRALTIWDSILRHESATAICISFENERTFALGFGERAWVRLFESVRREPEGFVGKDIPTGTLRFFIDGPYGDQGRFSDNPGSPLETQTQRIVEKLVTCLHNGMQKTEARKIASAEARVRAAEMEAEFADKERQRKLVEDAARAEAFRRDALTDEAARWAQAIQLRTYLAAVTSAAPTPLPQPLAHWLAWAETVAQEIDPIERRIKATAQ